MKIQPSISPDLDPHAKVWTISDDKDVRGWVKFFSESARYTVVKKDPSLRYWQQPTLGYFQAFGTEEECLKEALAIFLRNA